MKGDYLGKVVVEGKLPGLNGVIASNRTGWRAGSGEKKTETTWCMAFAKDAMKKEMIRPIKKKVTVMVTWYEENKRRDHDNILGGGLKMAFDGFVAAGLLPDDSQRYVGKIISEVKTDKTNPRVTFNFYEE